MMKGMEISLKNWVYSLFYIEDLEFLLNVKQGATEFFPWVDILCVSTIREDWHNYRDISGQWK